MAPILEQFGEINSNANRNFFMNSETNASHFRQLNAHYIYFFLLCLVVVLMLSCLLRVAQAYVNQRKLDHEVKTLQVQASQFSKQTAQWISMVEGFNQALKASSNFVFVIPKPIFCKDYELILYKYYNQWRVKVWLVHDFAGIQSLSTAHF